MELAGAWRARGGPCRRLIGSARQTLGGIIGQAKMSESRSDSDFDLEEFLPYLLNQAAEATSRGFQSVYRERYGMTRTQWRVMANLGKFGSMTARDICAISHIEKSKVSRSVTALEAAGILIRTPSEQDRRVEHLALSERGSMIFRELGRLARDYDEDLRHELGIEAVADFRRMLLQLAKR